MLPKLLSLLLCETLYSIILFSRLLPLVLATKPGPEGEIYDRRHGN